MTCIKILQQMFKAIIIPIFSVFFLEIPVHFASFQMIIYFLKNIRVVLQSIIITI